MADGYFRVKHQPVATLTSTGPGSANLVMSLATALSDSSAFLAITSNVPTSQMNRAPFQEIYKHNQADFPSVAAPGGEARVPAHARGHAAARAAPGLRHDGHRPARAGEPRRARTTSTRKKTTSRCRPRRTCSARTGPARRTPTSRRAVDLLAERDAPGALHRPRRDAVRGGPGDHARCSRRLGIPVITSPNGMGCVPGRRPAHARLHRPQRRLSRQPGRAPRRSRHHHRHALRRPLVVDLVSGLLVELPEDQARARRHRPAGARPQLPADARHHRRREGVHRAAAGARCASARRGLDAQRYAEWRAEVDGVAHGVGGVRAPALHRRDHAAAAGVRGGRAAERAARRRHPHARLRRAPQLVHAVLEAAPRRRAC